MAATAEEDPSITSDKENKHFTSNHFLRYASSSLQQLLKKHHAFIECMPTHTEHGSLFAKLLGKDASKHGAFGVSKYLRLLNNSITQISAYHQYQFMDAETARDIIKAPITYNTAVLNYLHAVIFQYIVNKFFLPIICTQASTTLTQQIKETLNVNLMNKAGHHEKPQHYSQLLEGLPEDFVKEFDFLKITNKKLFSVLDTLLKYISKKQKYLTKQQIKIKAGASALSNTTDRTYYSLKDAYASWLTLMQRRRRHYKTSDITSFTKAFTESIKRLDRTFREDSSPYNFHQYIRYREMQGAGLQVEGCEFFISKEFLGILQTHVTAENPDIVDALNLWYERGCSMDPHTQNALQMQASSSSSTDSLPASASSSSSSCSSPRTKYPSPRQPANIIKTHLVQFERRHSCDVAGDRHVSFAIGSPALFVWRQPTDNSSGHSTPRRREDDDCTIPTLMSKF